MDDDGDDDHLVREMQKELEGLDAEFVSGKLGAFGDRKKEAKVLQQLERIRKKQWDLSMVQVTVEDHRIMEPDLDDPRSGAGRGGSRPSTSTSGTGGGDVSGGAGAGPGTASSSTAAGSRKTKDKDKLDDTYDRMTLYFEHQEREFDTLRNQLAELGAEMEELSPLVVSLDAAERRNITKK